uniref:Uncharacterized protein n=1 Tax=Zosterops lateralis melanops TaxID=1220523 RepID=A0A8D2P335_ZOSLA
MCTPLLLQDKANLVEDYVAEHPELQRKLLQTLDTWCEPSFNIRDITRYRHLSFKTSRKCCTLKCLFSLFSALCPNVINQQHLRTLKYLFYKRFVEVCAVLCVCNEDFYYIYIFNNLFKIIKMYQ